MPHIDLLELPYFQDIGIDAVVSLVELMAPKQFAANEIIMKEGDLPAPPLYIATSGRVLVSKRNAHGQERSLAELNPPTLFGEIELLCQIPAVATARALTPVSTFFMDRPTFDRLFAAQHPAILNFTYNIARVACHRLAIADEMLVSKLEGEDLVNLRRAVFARMSASNDWSSTTGVFKRPTPT